MNNITTYNMDLFDLFLNTRCCGRWHNHHDKEYDWPRKWL